MTDFQICALSAADLDRIRARGTDDFGNPIVLITTTEEGGAPLRCCLQEARVGEQIALIAHRPSAIPGAYAEVGPVFVHAERCAGWTGSGYPDDYRARRQLLRAYDHAGRQVDNVLVEPGEAEAIIARLLARAEIAFSTAATRCPVASCSASTGHCSRARPEQSSPWPERRRPEGNTPTGSRCRPSAPGG